MRTFQVPAVTGPDTRARSNTLGIEMLAWRAVPLGSTKVRSTSLCDWDGVSGHHRAASSVFGAPPATPMGISMVAPFVTVTLPHHAQPSVGRRSGPAPLVLLNG